MEAVCSEPFRVGSLLWQPRPGAYVFTVVCKATFQLLPGELRLAATAANILPFDVPTTKDERGSLAAASDLVPFKLHPEVIVSGHAHAPGGRPLPQLLVRVAVGDLDKVISVHGERHFSRDGELHDAAPFTAMPLSWERAAGGPETANPVGIVTGRDARADAAGRVALPNLQPIGRFFPSRSEVIAAACFGPVAAAWPNRRACLGPHAAAWDPLRWSERPLPPDVGGAYFQAAPSDQMVAELPAGVRIYLENLHPRLPQLTTRLPAVVPSAVVELGGTASALALRCDTLSIDTDRELVTVVYRGSVPLDHPHREGRVVITAASLTAAAPVPAQIAPAAPAAPATAPAVKQTQLGGASGPALPFAPASTEVAAMLAALPPEMRAKMSARLAALGNLSNVPVSGTALPLPSVKPALPFAGQPAVAAEDGDDTAETGRPPPPDPADVPSAAEAVAPAAFVVPAAWAAATFSVRDTMAFPVDAVPAEASTGRAEEFAPPPSPPEVVPAPPPLLGPLAKIETTEPERAGDPPAAALTAAETDDDGSPAAAPAEAPAEADEPPALDDYPIERYARIAALVELREADSAQIWKSHGLSPGGWERLRRHWSAAAGKEATRGKSTLMRAYDAAYIAQIEAERGPITIAEYAALAVAMDDGTADAALGELGLPPRSAMPIRRAWAQKMVKDPKLGGQVRRAIEDERNR